MACKIAISLLVPGIMMPITKVFMKIKTKTAENWKAHMNKWF